MPMGETFLRPNRQTGPERVFFPAAERSAPQEVIMKSLLFINNSIDSLQIYYGHFFCLFFLLLLERLQKISLANPVRQD